MCGEAFRLRWGSENMSCGDDEGFAEYNKFRIQIANSDTVWRKLEGHRI